MRLQCPAQSGIARHDLTSLYSFNFPPAQVTERPSRREVPPRPSCVCLKYHSEPAAALEEHQAIKYALLLIQRGDPPHEDVYILGHNYTTPCTPCSPIPRSSPQNLAIQNLACLRCIQADRISGSPFREGNVLGQSSRNVWQMAKVCRPPSMKPTIGPTTSKSWSLYGSIMRKERRYGSSLTVNLPAMKPCLSSATTEFAAQEPGPRDFPFNFFFFAT